MSIGRTQRDIDEMYPIITDPLAWQDRIDASGLSPNTRGSIRFWRTVETRGLAVVSRDGWPDCSTIVLGLGDGLGLELRTDADSPFIRYRFVAVTEEGT